MISIDIIMRYPRLNTILMVEEFIQVHSGEFGRVQLWKLLPKKMMYQTYQVIIGYLIDSKKIFINEEKKMEWVVYKEIQYRPTKKEEV